ncbi:MAG TPA: CRISPR-associated endonuclease Cas3'' [Phycisphaerales bacterium]|nr:CRISPR-associated endonuclease Cas3'' [Phycisphaerales bacterium]
MRGSGNTCEVGKAGVGTHYAHTLDGKHESEWEVLSDHLQQVAALAGQFADAFGANAWGHVVGAWHDLGKYSDAFQHYLRASNDRDAGEENAAGRVDHSTFGAQYAMRVLGGHIGQLVAFCIAGHHGHLPDATSAEEATFRSSLQARLAAGPDRVPPVQLPPLPPAPALRFPFKASKSISAEARRLENGFRIAFFTRMLFSCLIDADRTATEKFCNQRTAAERAAPKPSLHDMSAALDQFLSTLKQDATRKAPSVVNEVRARVLDDCIAGATLDPGFFSLTVPTGGGKTLSSLAFALKHAHAHELRRVVVAIPFTSIIEQTADAYRSALGPLADRGLIEHHSNIEPNKNTRENKLATENWDAPLIVTTNVQLFESMFASATTPCRKLHRLARSVIILDEAQTIPIEYLQPTLQALKELVENYGCTVVLCTATQPALEKRDGFAIGIEGVRPIIGDPAAFQQSLQRVRIHQVGRLTDDELSGRLAGDPSVLCIVNTRPHAAKLYDALTARVGAEACFHLSTFMCAQHRRDVLKTIRQRLQDKEACRVISTQLIEAGIDVDFPVVYRAPAGFDSIAQAAGRCNREGALPCGQVYVFEAETPVPAGMLRQAAQAASELIDQYDDLLSPQAIEAYFRLFYWSQSHQWDKRNIMPQFVMERSDPALHLQFKTAASLYRLIDDVQFPVLVTYDDHARNLQGRLLRGESIDYFFHREAQRYLVSVPERLLRCLEANHVVTSNGSGLWWVINEQAYSADKGLIFNKAGIDPDLLMD